MRVYIAAPYSCKESARIYALEFIKCGIEITSRWLEEPEAPSVQLKDVSTETLRRYAQQDIEDVLAADLLVFLTDETKSLIRAGRHVEFGVALGKRIPIYVLGEPENLF